MGFLFRHLLPQQPACGSRVFFGITVSVGSSGLLGGRAIALESPVLVPFLYSCSKSVLRLFKLKKKTDRGRVVFWRPLQGSNKELFVVWSILILLSYLVQNEILPSWWHFLVNSWILIFPFRFSLLHASLAVAFSCLFRLYQATARWTSMIPFSEFLFFHPPSTNEMLKVSTIISVQLFIIERCSRAH